MNMKEKVKKEPLKLLGFCGGYISAYNLCDN